MMERYFTFATYLTFCNSVDYFVSNILSLDLRTSNVALNLGLRVSVKIFDCKPHRSYTRHAASVRKLLYYESTFKLMCNIAQLQLYCSQQI